MDVDIKLIISFFYIHKLIYLEWRAARKSLRNWIPPSISKIDPR